MFICCLLMIKKALKKFGQIPGVQKTFRLSSRTPRIHFNALSRTYGVKMIIKSTS